MPTVKLPSGKKVRQKYTKKGVAAAKSLAKKSGGKMTMGHGKGMAAGKGGPMAPPFGGGY